MNQDTFNQIINSDQPIVFSPELFAAAHCSAQRQRSEALHAGVHWIETKTCRAINSTRSAISYLWHVIATGIAGSRLIVASNVQTEKRCTRH